MTINKMGKKGVSPIVSTVLLIMIVILMASIIIMWSRGFTKEQILKFDKPIERVCLEVKILPYLNDDGTFGFQNKGNVPIYAFNVKTSGIGGSSIEKYSDSVNPGASMNIDEEKGPQEVRIIPILLGKDKTGGTREYPCPENTGVLV